MTKQAFMEGFSAGVECATEWGPDVEEAYKAFKKNLSSDDYTQEDLLNMNRIQLIGIINRLQLALKG